MQDQWKQYLCTYEKILDAGYQLAEIFEHGGIQGEIREYFVKMFLEKIVPEAVGIGTGQITDRNGKKSRQIDIVIYDRRAPVLGFGADVRMFPIEGVIATVEIKSTINSATLALALDNCKSVTDLNPTVKLTKETRKQFEIGDTAVEWAYPATYVFGFKGYKKSAKDLRDGVENWHNSKHLPAGKHSLGLLSFPRAVVTEGCVGLRRSKLLNIEIERGLQVAFAAKVSDTRLQFFVADLLSTILQKIGTFTYPEGELGIAQYFQVGEAVNVLGVDNWEHISRKLIV